MYSLFTKKKKNLGNNFDMNQQTNSEHLPTQNTKLGWGGSWNRTNSQGISNQIRHLVNSHTHINVSNCVSQYAMQSKLRAQIISARRIQRRKNTAVGVKHLAVFRDEVLFQLTRDYI